MELQLRVVARHEYPPPDMEAFLFCVIRAISRKLSFGAGALESFKVRGGALRFAVGGCRRSRRRPADRVHPKADRRAYRPTIDPSWCARGRRNTGAFQQRGGISDMTKGVT